jgi:hypothetical protein
MYWQILLGGSYLAGGVRLHGCYFYRFLYYRHLFQEIGSKVCFTFIDNRTDFTTDFNNRWFVAFSSVVVNTACENRIQCVLRMAQCQYNLKKGASLVK